MADEKGFERTGGVVKVQVKAEASYLAWDNGPTLAVSVKREDIEYSKSSGLTRYLGRPFSFSATL